MSAVAACGDGQPAPGVTVHFARAALVAQATGLIIYYYPGSSTCAALEATTPRTIPLRGPYQAMLDDPQRQQGLTFTQSDVPVGGYVILIDAVDDAGRVVGTGCTPGVQVKDRQLAKVTVTIS